MNTAVEPKPKSAQVQVAGLIRQELKRRGLKNTSVRSSQNKVVICVENLCPKDAKDLKKFVQQFELGHFCGYEDTYVNSNKNADIPQVKFVNFYNSFSDDLRQKAYNVMLERSPKNYAFMPTDVTKVFHYHRDLDNRSVTETLDRVLEGNDNLWSRLVWSDDQLVNP
jgi:hypothetical protein